LISSIESSAFSKLFLVVSGADILLYPSKLVLELFVLCVLFIFGLTLLYPYSTFIFGELSLLPE